MEQHKKILASSDYKVGYATRDIEIVLEMISDNTSMEDIKESLVEDLTGLLLVLTFADESDS